MAALVQSLPPSILALFAPRAAIEFKKPIEKKKQPPFSGLGAFVGSFESAEEQEEARKSWTPYETLPERQARAKARRAARAAAKQEQTRSRWDPHADTRAVGDPFCTLFVGRLSYDTDEASIERTFGAYGPVRHVRVVRVRAPTPEPDGGGAATGGGAAAEAAKAAEAAEAAEAAAGAETGGAEGDEGAEGEVKPEEPARKRQRRAPDAPTTAEHGADAKVNGGGAHAASGAAAGGAGGGSRAEGRSRGYAFVEFSREADAKAAVKELHGSSLDGRRIVVDVERGRTVKAWEPRKLGGGLGVGRTARTKSLLPPRGAPSFGGRPPMHHRPFERHSGPPSSSDGGGGGGGGWQRSGGSGLRGADGRDGPPAPGLRDAGGRPGGGYGGGGGGLADRFGVSGGGGGGAAAGDYGSRYGGGGGGGGYGGGSRDVGRGSGSASAVTWGAAAADADRAPPPRPRSRSRERLDRPPPRDLDRYGSANRYDRYAADRYGGRHSEDRHERRRSSPERARRSDDRYDRYGSDRYDRYGSDRYGSDRYERERADRYAEDRPRDSRERGERGRSSGGAERESRRDPRAERSRYYD